MCGVVGYVGPRQAATLLLGAVAPDDAVGLCQAGDALLHHGLHSGLVEDRIARHPPLAVPDVRVGEALPILLPLHVVADLLRVQVRLLVLDGLEVKAHVEQDLLRDDGRHIDDWNKARSSHALKYNALLGSVPQVKCPKLRPDTFHIFHLYVVRAERRGDLAAFLKTKGVFTGIHYPYALPLMPAYRYLRHQPSDFPVAYACQGQILSLPMYPELSADQIAYVAESIKEFYK